MNREKFKEIFRLDEMLTESNIPHEFRELFDGYQICYPYREWLIDDWYSVCDAVEHSYSYGSKEDKLELLGLLTDEESQRDIVVGWLTAEDVFERIKKHYDGIME